MRALSSNPNVDLSDLTNYPDGRIKNNTGTGNGTPVNENVYGDIHQTISKLMRLWGVVPNGLPDNETNGFQIVEALRGLASKNDYIYPLATNGTDTLSIDTKLHLMNRNEYLVCLAGADKTTETLIKGSATSTFAVSYSGNFKANEYVRVIKTVSGFSIIRLADWNSLNAMVSELGYLKKASYAQEIAGASDAVATNPLSNALAFVERVNGASSSMSLATAIRNGLYPKEHFAIVQGINIKNRGTFTIDIGGSAGAVPSDGNITSAVAEYNGSTYQVVINLANNMDNTNYLVKTFIQSLSSNMGSDNNSYVPVFKVFSVNQVKISFREGPATTQNIRVHIEVVQL